MADALPREASSARREAFAKRTKQLSDTLRVGSPDVKTHLRDAFADAYRAGADAVRTARGTEIALDNAADRAAEYADDRAGHLITDIDGTTEERVQGIIASGVQGDESTSRVRDRLTKLFGDDRAQTIARTEMATAWNKGIARALRDAGEEYVYVTDGDEDEECSAMNEQIIELEEAEDNPLEHPNCTREFRPLTDEELAEMREEDEGAQTTDELGDEEAASARGGERFYSEDQERDERGRWTSGGPGGHGPGTGAWGKPVAEWIGRGTYDAIRAHQLGTGPKQFQQLGKTYLADLETSLSHAPVFEGTAYRGLAFYTNAISRLDEKTMKWVEPPPPKEYLAFEKLHPGSILNLKCYQSFTASETVGKMATAPMGWTRRDSEHTYTRLPKTIPEPAKYGVLLAVETDKGRDISTHAGTFKWQKEVLLGPTARIRVTKVEKDDKGRLIIHGRHL